MGHFKSKNLCCKDDCFCNTNVCPNVHQTLGSMYIVQTTASAIKKIFTNQWTARKDMSRLHISLLPFLQSLPLYTGWHPIHKYIFWTTESSQSKNLGQYFVYNIDFILYFHDIKTQDHSCGSFETMPLYSPLS